MENTVLENNKFDKKYMYVLYFFIFAFLGWVLETIYCFIVLGHFTKRGFLYGPLCPIYGWGAIILIAFLSKYKDNGLKLFTYSAIVFSVFEYYVSYLLEALFKAHWWDYTTDFLNLNGRISIFYTIAWGIIALVFVGYIYPFVEKHLKNLIYKIKNRTVVIGCNLLVLSYVLDTILSCIRYLHIL